MNYREQMLRTVSKYPERLTLTHAALGLAGESGEVVDALKKQIVYGRPADLQKLVEELGDVRWYMEMLLHLLNVDMATVEALNIEKLKKRYPECF